MGGKLLQVLNFLLAIEHLPALDAEDLAVAFLFDEVKLRNKSLPFGRVALDELPLRRPLGSRLLHDAITGLASSRVMCDGLASFGRLLSASVDGAAAPSNATHPRDDRHFWRLLHLKHLLRELIRFMRIIGAFEALVNERLILLVIHVSSIEVYLTMSN